ncbi:MAG TPA: PP2C family protein-serine/threonine phosphatase [Ignavibacteriaceae bacterium]|nr:PP2C family protein-serine/threonine phosphatase [Ignavibacteriaceae bacterium]
MSEDKKQKNKDPRLGKTLREDFRQTDFIGEMKKEFRELKNFYIDEHKKERLQNMNSISGFFHVLFWIIKSMFFHLTPLRRMLTVAGVLLVLMGRFTYNSDGSTLVFDNNSLGAFLILFVLMLELKDKLLAKTELEDGRKVQKALLPDENPQIPGWKVWLYSRPANEVCGDLVDYLNINDKIIGLTMADVAGKGLSAALMMSKLQSTIRAIANDKDTLSEFAGKVNKIFNRDSLPSLFASMLYLQIEPGSGKINYVNAGHLPPFILRGENIEETEKGDAAIGIIKDSPFTERSVELNPGESFIVFSDGVTEAISEAGQFFGKQRLINTVKKFHSRSADKLGEAITQQVEYFTGNAPRSDDLSLIILKRE